MFLKGFLGFLNADVDEFSLPKWRKGLTLNLAFLFDLSKFPSSRSTRFE
jgi:hypothetical protein